MSSRVILLKPALKILKDDSDVIGMISAGSTGAVLAGGLFTIGRMEGVKRPALAPFLPTMTGGQVLLIDCGANVDAKPSNLVQFAKMGSIYMQNTMRRIIEHYFKLLHKDNERLPW